VAGVAVWFIVMMWGAGCIEPPKGDPTWLDFERRRYGEEELCLASTAKAYWIIGIGAGLIVFCIGIDRAYGTICRKLNLP
jgi:hypothetical protein